MRPFNTGLQRRQDSAIPVPASRWWWKARPFDIVTETTTRIIIGIVLSFVGLGFLCWLLFTLAVYALPFAADVTLGPGHVNYV